MTHLTLSPALAAAAASFGIKQFLLWPFITGLPMWRVVLAVIVIVFCSITRKVLRWAITRSLTRFVNRPDKFYEEIIFQSVQDPIGALVLLICLNISTHLLFSGLSQFHDLAHYSYITYDIFTVLMFIWACYRLVCLPVAFLERMTLANDKAVSPLLISVIANTLRIVIVAVGLITLLSNFDINVVSLVAGLGVGGLAVALAVQDPLGNFFGFVALLSDSPFRIGDWIQMGPTLNRVDGIVEYVGFRSTRIRTFSRSLLTVPNNLLSKDIVENFSVVTKRRVKQSLFLSFQTPPEVIEGFLKELRTLITNDEDVDKEQIIACFDDFAGGGYSLLVSYYTKVTALEPYLLVKERINLGIVTLARKFDLSFVTTTSASFPVKLMPADASVKK